MFKQQVSYLSPKLEARPRPEKGGCGIYAREWVQRGELLVGWGGDVLTGEQLADMPALIQRYSIQVEENLYLVTTRPIAPADYVNHCCDPNAGLSGQMTLVALRNIAPNEEVCFDYAMSDGSPYDEFNCACGAPNCRGRVTGNDWMRPELWKRYAGHFSPYLQRRIERLKRDRVRQHLVPVNGQVSNPL